MVVISDLRVLLGGEARDDLSTPVLIVEGGGEVAGLVVDQVFDVQARDGSTAQGTAGGARVPGFVADTLPLDRGFLYLLRAETLVGHLRDAGG